MTLECKKNIVRWIMDNPGYVYSQFSFVPQHDDEVLPTEEEFEALTYNLDSWVLDEEFTLTEGEQKMYPGAILRFKYVFSPLGDSLRAQVFVDDNDVVQYVVVVV